jgi:hypothetical protein
MLQIGDTVLLRDHVATVAGNGWRDPETRVWVTFGGATVPSSVSVTLLTPCPACGSYATNRHAEGCPL